MKPFQWTVALFAFVLLGLIAGSALAIEDMGKITFLDLDKNEFTLTKANGGKLSFRFTKDVKVVLNDKNARLSDLKVGDQVTINYTRDGETLTVSDLRARRGSTEATGKITRMDTIKNEFSMEPKTGGKLNFRLSKDIKVQLNERNAKLSDLRVGDEVTINYTSTGDTLTVEALSAKRKE